ncbi:MAG: hypothetical protein AAFN51_04995 [Pseudomonadota bacterium]
MADNGRLDRFQCAPGLRLEAHERLSAVHFENVSARLTRLEETMERLEKRLWLTVYGVVAVILTEAFQSIVNAVP